MRCFGYFLVWLFSFTPLAIPAAQAAPSPCAKPVSVGWDPDEPWMFKDNETLKGIDVDIVKAVLGSIGCTPTFKNLPWERQLLYLESGELDMVTNASKQPEREAYAHLRAARLSRSCSGTCRSAKSTTSCSRVAAKP